MSYILEALKKLEQKHQRQGAPTLLTFQADTAPVSPKRFVWWPYVAAATVIVNGIILLLLLWTGPGRHSDLTGTAPTTAVIAVSKEKEQPGKPPEEPIKNEPSTALIAEKPSPVLQEHKISNARTDPAPRSVPKDNPEFSSSRLPSMVMPSEPKRATVEVPRPADKHPSLKGKLLQIQELPGDLKAVLPSLKMTVHSYNEAAQSRFAIVNDKTVREGQFLVPNLKVEQITTGGVIFSCQGYRFLLAINENP